MASLLLSIVIVLAAFIQCCNGSKADNGIFICRSVPIDKLNMTIITMNYISSPKETCTDKSTIDNKTSARSRDEQKDLCKCHINNNGNITITILTSLPENLTLQLDINNVSIPLDQLKEKPFDNPVLLSATQNTSTSAYSLSLEVKGDFDHDQVNCTDPVVTPVGVCESNVLPSPVAVKTNKELIFETPLLIIGAVLAVIGFLLLIAAIAVLRRYRKEQKRKTKTASQPVSNYEEISSKNWARTNRYSQDDKDTSSRKASMYSTSTTTSISNSNSKHKQEDASFCRSQSIDCTDSVTINHEQATARYKKFSIFSLNSGKNQKNKETGKKSKSADDEPTYYRVDLDNDHDLLPPPVSRVATPLRLLHDSATCLKPLRKTENLKEAQAKAMTMSKQELPNESDSCYFPKPTGKSLVNHSNNATTDVDANRSKTPDIVGSTAYPFKFQRRQIAIPNKLDPELAKDEGLNTSISSNQDDQDHIYEAVEKEEDNTMENDTHLSSQDKKDAANETKPEDDSVNTNGSATEEKCANESKKAKDIQPNSDVDDILSVTKLEDKDQASDPSHGTDNTYESIDAKHYSDVAPLNVENPHVDGTINTLSIPEIIPVKKPPDRSRQLNDIVQNHATKNEDVERNTWKSGESNPDINDFNKDSTEILLSYAIEDTEVETLHNDLPEVKDISDKEADTQINIISNDEMGEYTIVENILYESATLSQPPTVIETSSQIPM